MQKLFFVTALLLAAFGASAADETRPQFPPLKDLPERPEIPDALKMFDGSPVRTREDWFQRRRPELLNLFRHYIYGYAPPAPAQVRAMVEREDKNYFGGKATKREVTLKVGPDGAPTIELLLLTPNAATKPVPVLVAMNWAGNFALVDDPTIPRTMRWMYENRPGQKGGRAGEEARGYEKDYWCAEYLIERGYALATFYNGDICPDFMGSGEIWKKEGIHRHFFKPGQTELGPDDWGIIGAWAWGMSRVVDYLWTMPEVVDRARICAFGHSRNGKTALWAAAQDERFAVGIPHQSGSGGAVLWRKTLWGKVADFPWFAPSFMESGKASFNKLPVDQNLLIALVAPRAVLVTEGEKDKGGGEPAVAYDTIKAADPLYKFLGLKGLPASAQALEPLGGEPANPPAESGELMFYCRRNTDHLVDRAFWVKILDRLDGYWRYRDEKKRPKSNGEW